MPERAKFTPDVEKRAKAWLAKVPGSESGRGGHNQLFTAARGLVRGFSLSRADALRILAEDFNPRCTDADGSRYSWSDRELAHKVDDADVVPFGKPRGYLLNADRGPRQQTTGGHKPHETNGKPADGPGRGGPPPPGPQLDRGISLAALMATELQPPRFVIDGLFAEGISVLAARPKVRASHGSSSGRRSP